LRAAYEAVVKGVVCANGGGEGGVVCGWWGEEGGEMNSTREERRRALCTRREWVLTEVIKSGVYEWWRGGSCAIEGTRRE
jgi:hypothetical protein